MFGPIKRGFGCVVAVCCALSALEAVAQSAAPTYPTAPSIGGPAVGGSLGSSTVIDPPQRLATPPEIRAEDYFPQPYANFGQNRQPTPPPPYYDSHRDWTPQLLPNGLIYRSYLAGSKESRLATIFEHEKDFGWIWDITLGGRVGLFRFGTEDELRPEGFQIDLEGSGQPRLNMEDNQDLIAADFRAGLPITYGIGPWQTKVAYYHLSSHLGDEYMLKNPNFRRVNYSRDAFVFGQSYYVTDDVRLYGEVGWAFYSDVSEPWEFQFGVDYSPLCPTGGRGAPFAAVNAQLREELNYGGNVVAQAGWQWRPRRRGQLLRIGLQYYNGLSNQFELYDQFENKVGFGIWYDY